MKPHQVAENNKIGSDIYRPESSFIYMALGETGGPISHASLEERMFLLESPASKNSCQMKRFQGFRTIRLLIHILYGGGYSASDQ
jgi:hypothetical protein